MVYFNVLIEDTGETYRCAPTESLIVGMERLGRKGIPVGCRGGGCGVCKIKVVSGSYTRGAMSREHVTVEDEAAGHLLACKMRPTSDIVLRVIGKMIKSVCQGVSVGGPAIGADSTGSSCSERKVS